MRFVHGVAGSLDFNRLALSPSVIPALEIGIDDLIVPGDDSPARLRLPRRGQRCDEDLGRGQHLRARCKLRPFARQIGREQLGKLRRVEIGESILRLLDRAVGLGQDAWRLPAERPLVFADIGRVRGDIMVFGGTVGLVVCGVTAGAGWAMAVGDGLPMARFVGFVADPLTNVWRLRSKRTLTNRCLPISIYEYTA